MILDFNENSCFHYAALHDNLEAIRILSKCVLEWEKAINQPNRELRTPLHFSVFGKDRETCSLLIQMGCDSMVRDKYGMNPVNICCVLGKHCSLEEILFQGINCGRTESSADVKSVHLAASCGNLECLKVLQEHNFNMAIRDSQNRCALFPAAAKGQSACLAWLLEIGLSPNVSDNAGLAPIHAASIKRDVSCVETLLENGADAFQQDPLGRTFAHYAVLSSVNSPLFKWMLRSKYSDVIDPSLDVPDNDGLTVLHWAVILQRTAQVQDLIRFHKWELNHDKPPLHLSAFCGNRSISKQLIDNEIGDVNYRSKQIPAPAFIAIKYGHGVCSSSPV